MNVSHTISTLEFARFLVALTGTFLLGYGVVDCYIDLVAIWKSGYNGFREYASKTVLMLAITIFFAQLTILGFVCIAMTQPNRHHAGDAVLAGTSLSIFMSLLFMFIGAFGNFRKREFLLMVQRSMDTEDKFEGETD